MHPSIHYPNKDTEHFHHSRNFPCPLLVKLHLPRHHCSNFDHHDRLAFASSWALYKWNQIVCTLLSLASFEQCNTFEIQSYWFVYQYSFFIISSNIVVWIDHYLFFHSPVVGYLGCFQIFGAITNKSAINTM